jgi:diketogulonate reductase-like aldo/keto reductase
VTAPNLALNSGHAIPQLGFRHQQAQQRVSSAARRAFDGTLEALGSDYVDLFLIHWPLPTLYGGDSVSTWLTLEEFYREGRARSIGVSNFQVEHLRRLVQESDVVPAVNQIEVHPYLCNEEVRAADAEYGIVTEAWSPIAKARLLNDPTIGAIASRVDRTPAQVVLRWHIQRGDVIFPKSTTPARIKENFEIFDFELEPDDIAAISALDRGEEGRTGPTRTSSLTCPVDHWVLLAYAAALSPQALWSSWSGGGFEFGEHCLQRLLVGPYEWVGLWCRGQHVEELR